MKVVTIQISEENYQKFQESLDRMDDNETVEQALEREFKTVDVLIEMLGYDTY